MACTQHIAVWRFHVISGVNLNMAESLSLQYHESVTHLLYDKTSWGDATHVYFPQVGSP